MSSRPARLSRCVGFSCCNSLNSVLSGKASDRSQMKMTLLFLPKSSVLRKTPQTLQVVKYKLRNSRILVVFDVTNYTNFSNCVELWLIITI